MPKTRAIATGRPRSRWQASEFSYGTCDPGEDQCGREREEPQCPAQVLSRFHRPKEVEGEVAAGGLRGRSPPYTSRFASPSLADLDVAPNQGRRGAAHDRV